DLALTDETALALVHELDRIFYRENVALNAAVDVIDHGRERRRLAGAGLAGHQDQPADDAAHLAHRLGHLQLIERECLGGYRAEDGAHPIDLPHDIDAEASAAGEGVGEIRALLGLEALERLLRHDLVQRLLDRLGGKPVGLERGEITVQADARRVAGNEVQVRAALLQHLNQQLIDEGHGLTPISWRNSPPRRRAPRASRSSRPSVAWWCR